MKFTAREDIEAPIEVVFEEVSDFEGFEKAALRRGAEIARTDALNTKAVGMSWRATFLFRNRSRDADLRLVRYDPPQGLEVEGDSGGIGLEMTVSLMELSPRRTRMQIETELKPKTISARLLVQSMKLAKTTFDNRFRKRIGNYAKGIEERRA